MNDPADLLKHVRLDLAFDHLELFATVYHLHAGCVSSDQPSTQ